MSTRSGRERDPWRRRRLALPTLILLCLASLAAAAAAEEPSPEIAAVRAEIAALRAEHEARIAALEARLAALEAAGGEPATDDGETAGDELAALRAAAAAAAGPATAPATAAAAPAGGHERNLSLLNPELSATGIFVGRASDAGREEFEAQEFELDLQAALDPFSRMRLTLAFEGEEVEVEEGWIDYAALPGGLDLVAGRFRQRFGALNRQHLHALPQSAYPLPLATYLGEEGLAQTGLSLSWLLPHPWATANEVTLEVTDGDSEAFGGESFDRLSLLGHVKSFWETSPASYLEWGLSGVVGEGPEGGDRRVWGSDLTYHWQPPAEARYRELTWRSELLLSQRDSPAGGTLDAWGGYSYLEGLVARNLYLGLLVDGAEDPADPESRAWSVAPYLTWWQSEFVRLRAELRHLDDDARAEAENQLVLQLTWAAGPHKHETY